MSPMDRREFLARTAVVAEVSRSRDRWRRFVPELQPLSRLRPPATACLSTWAISGFRKGFSTESSRAEGGR
jgi:hypothetical protein